MADHGDEQTAVPAQNNVPKINGRPWPKGVSGNPGGRPKRTESWADLIARLGKERAEDGRPQKHVAVERLYHIAIHGKDDDAIRALSLIFDRTEGRAPQLHELANAPGESFRVTNDHDGAATYLTVFEVFFAGLRGDELAEPEYLPEPLHPPSTD